jgi:hypothetical protein
MCRMHGASWHKSSHTRDGAFEVDEQFLGSPVGAEVKVTNALATSLLRQTAWKVSKCQCSIEGIERRPLWSMSGSSSAMRIRWTSQVSGSADTRPIPIALIES